MPLFVPCTPGGELAKRISNIEKLNNQGRTIRFKVVERRGVTLEEKLRKSNPWAGERQGCISCGTCSYPELTEDHVLTSAYVKIFRIVTRNAVNKSF